MEVFPRLGGVAREISCKDVNLPVCISHGMVAARMSRSITNTPTTASPTLPPSHLSHRPRLRECDMSLEAAAFPTGEVEATTESHVPAHVPSTTSEEDAGDAQINRTAAPEPEGAAMAHDHDQGDPVDEPKSILMTQGDEREATEASTAPSSLPRPDGDLAASSMLQSLAAMSAYAPSAQPPPPPPPPASAPGQEQRYGAPDHAPSQMSPRAAPHSLAPDVDVHAIAAPGIPVPDEPTQLPAPTATELSKDEQVSSPSDLGDRPETAVQENPIPNPSGSTTPLLPPPSRSVRTASRSPTRSSSPHSTSYIRPTPPPSPRVAHASLAPSSAGVLSSLRKSVDEAVEALPDTMLFGQSAERRRRAMANTSALTEYEADMTGKDRVKQKAAIQKFLAEKIRNDWEWEWPRPDAGAEPRSLSGDLNAFKDLDEETQWRQREEGESDASDSDPEIDQFSPSAPASADRPDSGLGKTISKSSPFRFDNPDGVGETLKKRDKDRRRRRKKRLAHEMTINDGLNCWIQRRDAWTSARKVPNGPSKKAAPRRPSAADTGSSTAIDSDVDNDNPDSDWDYETEVPVARDILPKENGMRASIGPAAYNTIYDKVIVQQLSPSCPINLKDITRSCVQGWKKDGEWPPRPTPAEGIGGGLALLKKKRRKGSLAGILGLNGEREDISGGAMKSPGFGGRFKKILGLGKEKEGAEGLEIGGHGNFAKV
ncbi:hypothetical protein BP6252_03481 [Coleophoma cylindrospora]|uniref:Gag1-like clamp domain-containing protein n=1 Tax=Coleophoma cylindrospora TaxID=1849047 RepID=A0A3D8S7T3_9HELO|nr:hypothetical protein BP6252_03481 [Coleophoma cylindrospora]